MPYSSTSEVPSYVPQAKRAQWMAIWNKTYSETSGSTKDRETAAFRAAGVVFKGVGIIMLKALEAHVKKNGGGYVAFDLDGTLACDDVPEGQEIGAPIPSMIERVKQYLQAGTPVRIITARMSPELPSEVTDYQRYAIGQWVMENIGYDLTVQAHKDPGMIRLYDDRALNVQRNTGVVGPDMNPLV